MQVLIYYRLLKDIPKRHMLLCVAFPKSLVCVRVKNAVPPWYEMSTVENTPNEPIEV